MFNILPPYNSGNIASWTEAVFVCTYMVCRTAIIITVLILLLELIYETFFRIISEGYEDYLYSDIALSFFESLYYWIESNKFLFNDFEFYNRCFESLQTIKEFIH